jgi:hypothetical protein
VIVKCTVKRPEDVGVGAGDAYTTVLPGSPDDSIPDRVHRRPGTIPEALVLKPGLPLKRKPLGGTSVRARAFQGRRRGRRV